VACMENLVVDCLRSRTSLDQLKGVWQTLERADALCTPFSSWLWADTWWREIGSTSDKLRLVIVKNGQEVVGICPLYLKTAKHYRVLSMTTLALLGDLPGIQSIHPGVIALPRYRKDCEIAVMKFLPTLKGWDTLDLDGIDVPSSFAMRARKSMKTRRGEVADEVINQIDQQSLLGSWNEYCAVQDGQRAVELKRLDKTLNVSEAGSRGNGLSICSTRQDLNDSQDGFYSLSQQIVDKKSKDRIVSQERFFRSIVPEYFLADMLWQLTLHIDGKIVGVQHFFIWRGDLLLFQGAYAPELERVDIVKFMLAYAIKRGIGQAFSRVRIHSLPSEFAHPFVSGAKSGSHLRFTPSKVRRVVDKMLKTLNKA
jgi:hypothetical protein